MIHISEGYLPIKHLEVPLISIRLIEKKNKELKRNTLKRIQDDLKKKKKLTMAWVELISTI